jgi:hypothetical protein
VEKKGGGRETEREVQMDVRQFWRWKWALAVLLVGT